MIVLIEGGDVLLEGLFAVVVVVVVVVVVEMLDVVVEERDVLLGTELLEEKGPGSSNDTCLPILPKG